MAKEHTSIKVDEITAINQIRKTVVIVAIVIVIAFFFKKNSE